MGVGIRVKNILYDRNMTIKELAQASGVSVNTLYSITKRDSNRVNPVILKKIATTLGVPASYLVGVTDDQGNTDLVLTAITLSEMTGIDRFRLYDAIMEMMDSDYIDPRNAFSDNDLLDAIKAKARSLELHRHIEKSLEGLKEYLSHPDAEQDSSYTLVISPDLQANRTAMFDLFKRLNEHGQKEALKRIEELTELPQYQSKPSTPEDK